MNHFRIHSFYFFLPVEVDAVVVKVSVLVVDVVKLVEVVAVTAACVIDNQFNEIMLQFCINANTDICNISDSIISKKFIFCKL